MLDRQVGIWLLVSRERSNLKCNRAKQNEQMLRVQNEKNFSLSLELVTGNSKVTKIITVQFILSLLFPVISLTNILDLLFKFLELN